MNSKKYYDVYDYLSSSYNETTDYVHIEIPTIYPKLNLIAILISLYLLYQKILDNLMVSWLICFYPVFCLLIFRFIQTFLSLIQESNTKNILSQYISPEDEIILKLENLTLLSNLFSLINFCFYGFSCFFIAEYMDSKKNEWIFYFMNVLIGCCLSHLIFNLTSSMSYFDIKRNNNPDNEANIHIKEKESILMIISGIITPIMTYLSNMMIICSANSGVCTQFYLSTLTSILGAFGITISNISSYLFPITLIMLVVSNISLYIKRKKFTHPPFLLGLLSTFLIILSKVLDESILNYIGSITMIIAAIWNMKMNKFFGLPSKKM